jgi:hypothetical protein
MTIEPTWVPQACTLPSAEQPLRVAEFGALFDRSLRSVRRVSDTRLELVLTRDAEETARDLTARETACCSFFTFTLTPIDRAVRVDIDVPAARVAVLDALAARALHGRIATG